MPVAAESVLSVPIEFFTNGWIQALTDSEIWKWLVFRHAAYMSSPTSPPGQGVRMSADTRLSIYDLTRDAWDTHLMLGRYGPHDRQPRRDHQRGDDDRPNASAKNLTNSTSTTAT